MLESALNAMARQYLDLTLCKSRYDDTDIQWFTEGPFWRRTNMRFSREYRLLPDYEIGDLKHGRTLSDIESEAGHLIANLTLYAQTSTPAETRRVDYLIEHVGNLRARTRMLLGEHPRYDAMTDDLYGLVAPRRNLDDFAVAAADMGAAIPGAGAASGKIWAFRKKIVIPPEKLLKVMTDCTMWFHKATVRNMSVTGNSMPRVRTREYPNPDMEFLSILFGYDYNHIEYERNFNLRYAWTVDHITECIGHEMEPGHLTYYEKRTQAFIDTCWPEMAVVSQYSASSAFTEGSARHVIGLCFDRSMDNQVEFEREYILKNAGLDERLADLLPLWHKYAEIAGYAKLEATRNVWDGIWTKREAIAYLKEYGYVGRDADEAVIDQLLRDPGHFTSHDYARDVVRDYFDSTADSVGDQWRLYGRLCRAHMSMRGMRAKTYTPVDEPDWLLD